MNARTEVRLVPEDLIPDHALGGDDKDSFDHYAIAGRVADLVEYADTPVNIGLFGPWGSGKSSLFELMRRTLTGRSAPLLLVRYDAWKYGGASLHRNFISFVADQLGFGDDDPENRDFHRGLYERRRTVDLDFRYLIKSHVGGLLKLLAIAVGVGAALLVAISAIASAATGKGFITHLRSLAVPIGAPIASVLFGGGALLNLLDAAKVEIEHLEPSADEQFTHTFQRLRTKALKAAGVKRLVIFIDELDRCSPEDRC